MDAGSSGTRVYVYKWKNPNKHHKDGEIATVDAHTLPKLKLKKSKKIHPGVSTFADDVSSVGRDHLQTLIDVALKEVPSSKIAETPVFLMATAGVRFLPQKKQQALLQSICTYFQSNTRFNLPDCDANVQVISGETEGLYGWIAANYLLGGFDSPDRHNHGKGHHTYGFLDMGGASAQIAFAPNATEAEKHSDDLKLVRMRRSDGSSAEYKVFSSTWLGFGANKARERFVESLVTQYGKDASELPDPCLPKGLRTTLAGESVDSKSSAKGQVLVGTGETKECIRKTYPLLGKDKPCNDSPCLLNGQHAPAIDFDINHFVGVSEYWHTTHGVFGKENNAYDLATYQQTVVDFCKRDWSSIKGDIKPRKKNHDDKVMDAQQACFKASWLINMLHDGIGIPRVGMEGIPSPGINTTQDALENAKGTGFREPFLPVDKIDGIEVSWTLGKMVLYAAGQIEPKDSKLPVGFGSNVKGVPDDFEHAGSSPIPSGKHDDHDDDDDFGHKKSTSYTGLVFFILIIIGLAYWLRKPERRRGLFKFSPRRRKPGKGSRGFGFLNKLLGRNNATYERVMEEGELPEFELEDVDSDENDHSDSTEGSRTGRTSGLATPKLNMDEFRAPSAFDRTGLVVRTESREHLTPSLQMINAGRRSRNVSPTRMKSAMAA